MTLRGSGMLKKLLWIFLAAAGHVGAAAATTWQWEPFTDAYCANGTTTGIGVSVGPSTTRLLIYLEAGGACWSAATCYGPNPPAAFTTGYSAVNFADDSKSTSLLAAPGGFFDRSAAKNPYKDDTYVFVPYCTGDAHGGNNVVAYDSKHTAYHLGYADMTAYLRFLRRAFPAVTRVTLAGSSAGGYGALINWGQTQATFDHAEVDLIDDSGMPVANQLLAPSNPLWSDLVTNWNLPATLPAGCTACLTDGFDALITYYAKAQPADLAAYVTYRYDTVLPGYYGITAAAFQQALQYDGYLLAAGGSRTHYFAVQSAGHILFLDPSLAAGGVTLQTWLDEMSTDSPLWTDVP